ncbi:hypothetical protein BpHYR1_026507 [Brachionus plicatilis]|uniref:Uncharacterized protein n=1 Tax=Brachionus plicatilis TaxID=10195 RepID=A0A3M7PAA3_BRAPC|nr:hypothetical protein BpHYR1_026507 [Brachionus plicatilis]
MEYSILKYRIYNQNTEQLICGEIFLECYLKYGLSYYRKKKKSKTNKSYLDGLPRLLTLESKQKLQK